MYLSSTRYFKLKVFKIKNHNNNARNLENIILALIYIYKYINQGKQQYDESFIKFAYKPIHVYIYIIYGLDESIL